MLQTLKHLLALFTPDERRQLVGLLAVMVCMAVLEVAGIASVMPFMALLANPGLIHSNDLLRGLHAMVAPASTQGFMFLIGCVTLALMALGNAFGAFSTWRILRFAYTHEHLVSERLLGRYLDRPYVFFLDVNTADLTKRLFADVGALIHGALIPCMQASARAIVAVLIMIMLLAVNPPLALVTAAVLGGAYAATYLLARQRLRTVGIAYQAVNAERFRAAADALGGIKDIKLYGRERVFRGRFSRPAAQFAALSTRQNIIGLLPRYALEVIAFGGVILVALYLLAARRDLDVILPMLALYAAAGYRLMPALQQVFNGATALRFHASMLAAIAHDAAADDRERPADADTAAPLLLARSLELRGVGFRFPGAERTLFDGLDLEIRANTSVGFVGATGTGKTTLVDLIMGLLPVQQGSLRVDGVEVSGDTLRRWQRGLGYVPQQIYLSDDTIRRNIAFGVPDERIDDAAVARAARAAHLEQFIERELPKAYETVVGERGVRLSGGQRQRLGIARALYADPRVLVFDEATSALDRVTEAAIIDAVRELAGTRTILIVAHRLATVRDCDVIHLLDAGRVRASGRYDELIAREAGFRALAAQTATP